MFSAIFVADTKTIVRHDFVAPLSKWLTPRNIPSPEELPWLTKKVHFFGFGLGKTFNFPMISHNQGYLFYELFFIFIKPRSFINIVNSDTIVHISLPTNFKNKTMFHAGEVIKNMFINS